MNRLHETLDRLLEVVVLLDEDMTTTLARDGLTVSRAKVVWLLHHGGPITQRAIADALRVTPRNVTGLVDGLVAADLVRREPHPTDRRATVVSLTERGTTLLDAMRRDYEELAETLFSGMDGAQFDAFADGLDHVLDRLRGALASDPKEAP